MNTVKEKLPQQERQLVFQQLLEVLLVEVYLFMKFQGQAHFGRSP
jgi:hypothetical protein